MNHNDYENSEYWGAPSLQENKEVISVIVDISNAVRILDTLIESSITEGRFCEELKNDVIKHTCNSLLAYVRQEKSQFGSTDDNMNKAMYCLMDYQLSEVKAFEIHHQTETAVMHSIMNVMPEIDDERKYNILDHKIIDRSALYLTLEVIND